MTLSLKITPKVEIGLSSVHLSVLSLLLILHAFELITINPIFFKALLVWVGVNLIAFPAARRRFITPRIENPRCPNCGSYLTTTELYCENCKSVTKIPKER
jgi:hypothetical protein